MNFLLGVTAVLSAPQLTESPHKPSIELGMDAIFGKVVTRLWIGSTVLMRMAAQQSSKWLLMDSSSRLVLNQVAGLNYPAAARYARPLAAGETLNYEYLGPIRTTVHQHTCSLGDVSKLEAPHPGWPRAGDKPGEYRTLTSKCTVL